jgi:hypothetical protein
VDIVIANAGIGQKGKKTIQLTDEETINVFISFIISIEQYHISIHSYTRIDFLLYSSLSFFILICFV